MVKTILKQKIFLLFFGLISALVFLEVGLRVGGFIFYLIQEYSNRNTLSSAHQYRILCMGESTTALGGESSYPSQLEQILNANSPTLKFKVINKGMPNATTGTLLSHFDENLDRYKPNMVVTMMGANDSEYLMVPTNKWPIKINFFLEQFKVYKLIELLRLHIADKISEMKKRKLTENDQKKQTNTSSTTKDKSLAVSSREITFYQQEIKKLTKFYLQNKNAGELYKAKGKFDKAQKQYDKMKKLRTSISLVYHDWAQWYRVRDRYQEAELQLKKALILDPNNAAIYLELGLIFEDQKKYEEAFLTFKKAIGLDPKNINVLKAFGRCYAAQGKYGEAIWVYQKLLAISPYNYWDTYWNYVELGRLLRKEKRYEEAERILLKTIKINHKYFGAYDELGQCYMEQSQFQKAENLFKDAIATIQMDEKIYSRLDGKFYSALAQCYEVQGKKELAEENSKIAMKFKRAKLYPLTVRHYYEVADKTRERGIKLICMQYPLRSVEPLKEILKSKEGIVFVDNEKIFKDALREGSYDEYFTDVFAGNFGHCTYKGNQLIAKNLAKTILETVLKQ